MRHLVRDKVEKSGETESNRESGSGFRLPTKAILPLGIIAFCGMSGEGAMADWSALYMNKIVGQDVSFAALAFGAFTVAMTIGRVLGDYFIERFGNYKILIINSLVAIFGLSIALLFINPYIVLVGFFYSCFGLGNG